MHASNAATAARRSRARLCFLSLAAALLAAACTVGCGAFHSSPASSGMEKQISNGERIGAATRAAASQRRLGPAGTPAPAAARRKISGAEVTAIGDSVMAASTMALESVLPGIYIDARPSRQMPAGLSVLRRLKKTGQLRAVVIVGLGTNYIVTSGELNHLIRLIGPNRRLVLINSYVPDQWSKEVNANMAAFVKGHPAVVLADWFDTIRHRMYLLWPDHVHPLLRGTRTYARMVYQAVQATRWTHAATSGHRL
jgi:hypothetical protein